MQRYALRKVCILCSTMQVYLYIVVIQRSLYMISEHLQKSERNKIDIWWRSLERVHVSGLIAECHIDLNGIAVEVLLTSEFVHQNT